MKSCLHVAASKVLDHDTRTAHFEEAMKIALDDKGNAFIMLKSKHTVNSAG